MVATAPAANAAKGLYVDRDLLQKFHQDALNQQAQLAQESIDHENRKLADLRAQDPGAAAPPDPTQDTATAPSPTSTTQASTPAPTTLGSLESYLSAAGIDPSSVPSATSPARTSTPAPSNGANGTASAAPAASSSGTLSLPPLDDFLQQAGITDAASSLGQAKDSALSAVGQAKDALGNAVLPPVHELLQRAGVVDQNTPPPSASSLAPPPETPDAKIDSSSPEAFVRSITPAAEAAAAKLGVPAEALIGMAANETGYGRYAAGNNLFGIKGTGPAGSTNADTWEDYGSGPVQIKDNFRAYNSPAESFDDFVDLIQSSPRYKDAIGQKTVEGFVGALKAGGYMTDPNYVGKIQKIADYYGPVIRDASQPPGTSPVPATGRTSQFALGLSDADAYAACGPAAAIAFAQRYGRNPSAQEAMDLARSVGWTQDGGMNGVANEQALLGKMGVATRLEADVNWDHVAQDASAGNPVIVSTPGHYFYVDGARQGPGGAMQFHVGTSGTDLKGGSEWMTSQDMERRMGHTNGALYADHPLAEGPSVTETQPNNAWQQLVSTGQQLVDQGQKLVEATKLPDIGALTATVEREADQRFQDLQRAIASGQTAVLQRGQDLVNATAPRDLTAAPENTAQPSVWDRIGQGIADVFRGAFGPQGPGNRRVETPPEGGALDLETPLEQLGQIPINQPAAAKPSSLVSDITQGIPGVPRPPKPGEITSVQEAAQQAGEDALNRSYPSLGPGGLGLVDPRIGPSGDEAGAKATSLWDATGVDLGAAASAAGRASGQIAAPLATTIGGAAAGGGAAALTTDPNDPNRGAKIAAGAVAGGAAGALAPSAVAGLRRLVAPATAASDNVQSLLNTFDGAVRVGAAQADSLMRNGTITRAGAQTLAADAEHTATTDFFAGLRGLGQGDGVAVNTGAGSRPAGWIDGRILPTHELSDYWVSPEVADVVRNVFGEPGALTRYVLQPVAQVTGAIKETVLSGSPFHLLFEEQQALRANPTRSGLGTVATSMVNAADPTGSVYNAWRVAHAPEYEAAARAGVTLPEARGFGEGVDLLSGLQGAGVRAAIGGIGAGATTYATDKAGGADDQFALTDALKKAGLGAVFGGAVGSYMGEALWSRAVPTLKVGTWHALTQQGMGAEEAARFVNQTFGGLNLTRIARSPDVQAMARTIVFAPDLWEGMARQIGSTLTPGQVGDRARLYAATSAIAGAITLEGLNYAFSGHFTNGNDKGHELDLDVTRFTKGTSDKGQGQRVYVDILGLLKPVAEVGLALGERDFDTLGKIGNARFSQPVHVGESLLKNEDYRGKPIIDPNAAAFDRAAEAAGYAAGQAMPAGAQGLAQAYERGGVGGAAIEAATGMRVSSTTDAQAARANPTPDPLQQAYESVGLHIPAAPPSIKLPGQNRSISLTQDEARQYGGYVRDALQQMGISDRLGDYSKLPPTLRANALRRELAKAEEAAAGRLLSGMPGDEIGKRVTDRMQATPTPYATPGGRTGARYAAAGTPTPAPAGGAIAYPFGQPQKAQGTLTSDGGPDDGMTPGAVVQGLSGDALRQYSQSPRQVSPDLKRQVYAAYGISDRQQGQYVIDHRVPRALGGADDMSNLWPQPKDTDSALGYHAKDVAEAYLIAKYRSGSIPLEQAQRQAAYSWRDVYQRLPAAERQKISDQLDRLSDSERAVLTE